MGERLIKTSEGQHAFNARSPQLAGKIRSAFLLFDGQRTVQDVLAATQGLGVKQHDIDALLTAGMLQEVAPAVPAPVVLPERTAQERYRDAYPLAVALTGQLGLSGLRLNLSVEAATDYESLKAVAPKIQAAVGASAYAPLAQALFA